MEKAIVNRRYLLRYKKTKQEFKEYDSLISEVIKFIPLCNCICLYGELGAGKTYFTAKLLAALNVQQAVTSPTFVLMNEYIASSKAFSGNVYHIDVYRLTEEEFKDTISLSELLNSKGLVIIEWADKVKNLIPENRIDIEIISD